MAGPGDPVRQVRDRLPGRRGVERCARVVQTIVRHALGVDIASAGLELVTVMQRTDGVGLTREQRVDWFWTCKEWMGEPRICDPEKTSDLRWFPLTDLPDLVPAYERIVLAGLRDRSLPMDTAYGLTN